MKFGEAMQADYLVGFDIGGTKCAVHLGDAQGRPLDAVTFPTRRGFESVWQDLQNGVREVLRRGGRELGEVRALGISCGGPLDAAQGLICSPPNLPGWDNVPITRLAQRTFGVPAFLMNDANACALAEWACGAGRGCRDMVFLTMGTGLGAGLILNGRLHAGASGLAGEVGHIRLAAEGHEAYGKKGSWEAFCGGNGIAELAARRADAAAGREAAEAYRLRVGGADYSVKALRSAAEQGDAFACGLFAEVGAHLGAGLAILLDTLNPQRVVIGSIFARCEAFIRPAMEAALAAEALSGCVGVCVVVPAALGDEIGAFASLLVAREGLAAAGGATQAGRGAAGAARAVLQELIQRHPALAACEASIDEAFRTLAAAFAAGGKLLVCGNGGSAADAQHIVGELMKDFAVRRGLPAADQARLRELFPDGSGEALAARLAGALPALSLVGEAALTSAMSNDVGAEFVFAQQVYGLCRPGDAVLLLSTSGQSLSVLHAARVARLKGAATLAITGSRPSPLAELCDVAVRLPAEETYRIQEYGVPVYHALCRMLELHFYKTG